MDNKLSELSKPVAYTDADELRFNHATSDMWPIPLGFGKDAPLYSQEYVSALLAELEAKDSEIDAANAGVDVMCAKAMNLTERAESAEQRIAELEAKLASLKNEFGELWKGNVDLLARLATPVQASGWISWHGGMFRPVRSDTVIDVMFANGNVKPNICAGSVVFEWQKTPKDSQRVTAYRLHRRG